MFAINSPSWTPSGETIIMGGSSASASAQPRNAAKQEEKLTCLPVTVRMVEMAKRSDDGAIQIHGSEPGMLVLVGMVENIRASTTTGLDFSFNDSTGRIQARYYLQDESGLAGIEAGVYVTMAAQLRTSPTVHLSVTAMKPVRSADEVSYHMIEAVLAALRLQAPRSTGASMLQRSSTPQPKRVSAEMDRSPPKGLSAMPMGYSVTTASALPAQAFVTAPVAIKGSQPLQGDALKNGIIEFLKKEGEGLEEGISSSAVCARMAPAKPTDVIYELQVLVSEGEVFNTIDDNHFSSI